MQKITITQKDIEKAGIQNSENGMLIDELAYSANQWTSNSLYDINFEYEPYEPYEYNYEKDLFEATKTAEQLYSVAQKIGVGINANWERIAKEQKLQAGACVALNNPEEWKKLLETYTENLKTNGIDSMSGTYNKALEEETTEYHDNLYHEWLYGDHRYFAGVIYEIAKYYTNERNGTYDIKNNKYTFLLNEYDIEEYKDRGYRKNQMKRALLDTIKAKSDSRSAKDREQSEKRRAERERLAIYKKEQAEKAEQERKEKLLSMTI